jgi:hypothetical protein
LLVLIPLQAVRGQEPAGVEPVGDFPPVVSALSLVLFPKVIADVCVLRGYVCSDEFAQIRRGYGDLRAVDALYRHALRLSWNNSWEALLLSALASLDHRRVGVRVAGLVLWFPLTGEFEEEFSDRIAKLPVHLYADTPADSTGDRDKLQHFFGSALLAYMFESPGPAERVAEFVEWGEDLFVVGGANDERDIRADRQGMEFGLSLLTDRASLPSKYLAAPTQRFTGVPPWEGP